jgi:hypothetical protein
MMVGQVVGRSVGHPERAAGPGRCCDAGGQGLEVLAVEAGCTVVVSGPQRQRASGLLQARHRLGKGLRTLG